MERRMRRFRQELPVDEVEDVMFAATAGVLSLVDADGEPYGVPLSFAYDGNRAIYFHCARSGRKLDCIASDSRASFCIVARDDIRPEEFITYFTSVIAGGHIAVVTDADEILHGLRLLCEKYSPGVDSAAEIAGCLNRVTVLRLDIASLSGKEAIELTRSRNTAT